MKEQIKPIKEINEFLKRVTIYKNETSGYIKMYDTFNDFKEQESDAYLFEATSLYDISKEEEKYYPHNVIYYGGNGYRFYLVEGGNNIFIAIKTALSDGTLRCLSSIKNLEELKSLMRMNNVLNSLI